MSLDQVAMFYDSGKKKTKPNQPQKLLGDRKNKIFTSLYMKGMLWKFDSNLGVVTFKIFS